MNLNEEIRGSLSNRYCVQVITKLHSKLIIFVSRILVRGDLGDVTVNALKEPPVNNSHTVLEPFLDSNLEHVVNKYTLQF
jgi:hypothetical protein